MDVLAAPQRLTASNVPGGNTPGYRTRNLLLQVY